MIFSKNLIPRFTIDFSREITSVIDEIRDESITGIYIQTRLNASFENSSRQNRPAISRLSPSFSSPPHSERTGGSHDAKVAEVSRVYRFKNGVKGSRLDANKVEHLT